MENADTMSAFFSGKLAEGVMHNEPKRVELGFGIGIGTKGHYSKYIQKLREKSHEGNGIIRLGKDVVKDKGLYSISDQTDKFSPTDVPMVLILYYNILKDIRIKTVWKDSRDDMILEQYYDIPSAHSNKYDWWDAYTVYFMGPEDLDYGDYSIEITSYQLGYDNKIYTYIAELKFSVEDIEEENENLDKEQISLEKTKSETITDAKINSTESKINSTKSKEEKEEKEKEGSKEGSIKSNDISEEVYVEKVFGMK